MAALQVQVGVYLVDLQEGNTVTSRVGWVPPAWTQQDPLPQTPGPTNIQLSQKGICRQIGLRNFLKPGLTATAFTVRTVGTHPIFAHHERFTTGSSNEE